MCTLFNEGYLLWTHRETGPIRPPTLPVSRAFSSSGRPKTTSTLFRRTTFHRFGAPSVACCSLRSAILANMGQWLKNNPMDATQNRQNFVSTWNFSSSLMSRPLNLSRMSVMLPQLRLMLVRKSVEGVTTCHCMSFRLSLLNVFTFLDQPNDRMLLQFDRYEYLCNRE